MFFLDFLYKISVKRINYLYRYFPLPKDNHEIYLDRIVGVLSRHELYFSNFSLLNDPFECCPIYSAPKEKFHSWLKFKRKEGRFSQNIYNRTEIRWKTGVVNEQSLCAHMKESMAKHIQEEIGICCFSAKPDSLLMWTHYASSHTGVCFQFLATNSTGFFGEALPVCYKKKRPVLNIFDNNRDKQMEANFLIKNKDWSYEQEFRMVSPLRKSGFHRFPEDCLSGVIFGAKIDKEDEMYLRNVIKKLKSKLNFHNIFLNEKAYKLNIIPNIK